MKKKVLLILLVFISIFTITGCGKSEAESNLHKFEFVDMRYYEPKNYHEKTSYNLEDNKVINYTFEEDKNKHINLYYYKGKKIDNYVDEYDKYEEKTINGYKWTIVHSKDNTGSYDSCYIEYNGNLYLIELNATEKYQEYFDDFMKDVSFK